MNLNKFILRFLIYVFFALNTYSQVKDIYRYPYQQYFEDSTHVYWTWYPDPFAPPTLTDSTKGSYCGQFSFDCDLSDTVLVTIQNEIDSLVYCLKVISKLPPHFSLCIWVAGKYFDSNYLPNFYFRSDHEERYTLALNVKGHKKCSRQFGVLPDNYYWFTSY